MIMSNSIFSRSATIPAQVLRLNQFPGPARSGVGSTRILGSKGFVEQNTATIHQSLLLLEHYPEPAPNTIGQEDLPGGFRKSSIMNGQSEALYNLSRGVIQVDGVKVLFDAKA